METPVRIAQQSNPRNPSSQEVLKRIQEETERVRKRLVEPDVNHQQQIQQQEQQQQQQLQQQQPNSQAQQQQQRNPVVAAPEEISTVRTSGSSSPPPLLIEPSTGSYFEDPVPAGNMSSHLRSEHEAFKARLIDEVLGKDSTDKVPIEKVMMIIWQFRDDPQVVKFMTRFVAKFAGTRDVFDGIEFYLPQLAHMIIHLEAEWDDAILERFSLVIAQQSLHFALQLNWILQGAIEDYQPELPDGTINPNYNPLFFSRCIKLLTNMERCVVYHKPRSLEVQRLYEKGKITKQELQQLEHADRRFHAMQITVADSIDEEAFGGNLYYKRTVRTACYKPKRWKSRYFAIEEHMLNCYSHKGGKLVRSMPLEGASVSTVDDNKYKHMFCVSNRSFDFRMRASSEEDMNKWVQMLNDESISRAVFGRMDRSLHNKGEETDRVVSDLTPAQRSRYEFFRDERAFVRRLTDIAEELRFKEPPERKQIAPGLMRNMEIAPCVYSPLCNSTDIWRRVIGTLYKETRVFNTKARCPVIMYFLGARGEVTNKRKGNIRDSNLDVAEYMHLKFDMNDEAFRDTNSTIDEKDEKETSESNEKETEADEAEKDKLNDDDREDSTVWHDSMTNFNDQMESPTSSGGSRHLQRLLRDSFVSIPRKLASRLDGKQTRRASHLDTATDLTHVPILEGTESEEILPVAGGLSVGQSSILGRGGVIVGDMNEGEIDHESINRAKQVVSGGESWAEKSKRMLEEAKYKPDDAELEVVSVMSKSNDDLRQEVFIMQMIHYYKSVFAKANLPIWLKTYRILSTSSCTGLLEVLVDATSLDGLKKSDGYPTEGGLRRYFEEVYGGADSRSFKAAQRNFMLSLAGYSIISYLLGLKDRHNGNIMIDTLGHVIHIDFGFVMGMAPGHEFSMERAPFKLTKEYVEVMGGFNDDCYKEYERLVIEGFKEARKNSQIALGLVEIMMYESNYPCFTGFRYGSGITLKRFEKRLMLDVADHLIEKRAKALITKSYSHWGTSAYDGFQKWSNGYAI